MYSAFVNPDHITPFVSTIPALLAKSSMLWSSIFFIYTNKDLRKKFWKILVGQDDFKNYCDVKYEMQLVNKIKIDGNMVIIKNIIENSNAISATKDVCSFKFDEII